MTPLTHQAPPIDTAEPSARNTRTELRDALVAIAIATAGVASAVAMVIIPERLPAPEQAPVVCQASHAQRPADAMAAQD